MKKINKALLGAAVTLCMASLTGCIKETFPQGSTATDEQIAKSSSATEALASGMPAGLIDVWSTSSHCYFGYPAHMIIRDMMTGDYYHYGETGYSHFISWQRNQYMGDGYLKTQFTWNFYYGFLLNANKVIGAVKPESATDNQLAFLGEAYAFRAMAYLDMARMYEFLPNDIFTDGKNENGMNVDSLTVPIVTDETSPSEAASNPRASRSKMAAFIMDDLNKAQQYIVKQTSNDGSMPSLACVYGLKARLCMWLEDYQNAAEYADLAIGASGMKPLTQAQALDPATGYNTASQFMWSMLQTKSNDCVQSGIINWTSWVSNQTTFGYTGPATALYVVIDKNLYNRISDTDWRKLQWVAPKGSALAGKSTFPSISDGSLADYLPEYASVKFRPGNGDTEDYNEGASTAIPLMRVEEMTFIRCEALARLGDESAARDLLNQFMVTRDPNYNTTKAGANLIDEILFQKRIELWGEGQTYFDIKRLNLSVTRGYTGTNCQDTQSRLNTNGRPAWMNFVMVRTESNNNKAMEGMNNPDPSNKYSPWTE